MKQIITTPKVLGHFIQRVRKAKGLTQGRAGENFRIDQTTISSVEQGASGTRLETLFRILAALDLELIIQEKKSSGPEQEVEW